MNALTAPERRLSHRDKLTAHEEVLIAAASFDGDFTKWELAVACWKMNPQRFGMKGFETQHPDMNRVMMEIVGNKPSSPVYTGLLESPAPCTFRVTEAGHRAAHVIRQAAALVNGAANIDDTGRELYRELLKWIRNAAFIVWKANPSEPSRFEATCDFGQPGAVPTVRAIIASARDWCRSRGVEILVDPVGSAKRPAISSADLSDLDDFLTALEYRFPQLQPRKAKRA